MHSHHRFALSLFAIFFILLVVDSAVTKYYKLEELKLKQIAPISTQVEASK